MAFQANNSNTKKGFYSVFIDFENRNETSIGLLLTDGIADLRKLPGILSEELIGAVATPVLTNASKDLIIITTETTTTVNTNSITDAKTRIVFNNVPDHTFTISNNEGDVDVSYLQCAIVIEGSAAKKGLFPIGVCLSELSFSGEKGEEVKINSGDMVVTSVNTSVDFVLPSICEDIQRIINSSSEMGILFLSKNTVNNIYQENLIPFAGLEIKGNALGQTIISVTKENIDSNSIKIIEG